MESTRKNGPALHLHVPQKERSSGNNIFTRLCEKNLTTLRRLLLGTYCQKDWFGDPEPRGAKGCECPKLALPLRGGEIPRDLGEANKGMG